MRRENRALIFWIVVFVQFGGYSKMARAEEEVRTLSPETQQRVMQLLKNYKPKPQAARIEGVRIVERAGSSSPVASIRTKANHALQENGLWGFVGTAESNNGGTGIGEGFSICGLEIILNASMSTNKIESASIVIGKRFLPFGIRTSNEITRWMVAENFDTNTSDICAPSPGAEFTYQMQVKNEVRTSSLSGSTTSASVKMDVKCKVAPEVTDRYVKLIPGEALLVTCEIQAPAGSKPINEYVYIRDAGFYLPTSGKRGDISTRYEYSVVEFSN